MRCYQYLLGTAVQQLFEGGQCRSNASITYNHTVSHWHVEVLSDQDSAVSKLGIFKRVNFQHSELAQPSSPRYQP